MKSLQLLSQDLLESNEFCRLCLEIHSNNISMQLIENNLKLKIKNCLNLVIRDSQLRLICYECLKKLEAFHSFKKSCKEINCRIEELSSSSKICVKNEKDDAIFKVKTEDESEVEKDLENHQIEYDQENDNDQITLETNKFSEILIDRETDIYVGKSEENHSSLNLSNLEDESSDSICLDKLSKRTKKHKLKKIKTTKSKTKRYKPVVTPTYCRKCGVDLKTIENLSLHNSKRHGMLENNQFVCFGCKKVFTGRRNRNAHEMTRCVELKLGYKCDICNRYLPYRKSFDRHMKEHRRNIKITMPDNNVKCSKCSKHFAFKKDLLEHNLKEHKLNKHYVCETCGRIFNKVAYLKAHILVHTGEKPHVCSVCNYRTSQKAALNIHMRRHTGARPFSCDLCPQKCTTSSNLRAHRQRHLGVSKKYECKTCEKTFNYKDGLTDHIKCTHEGLRPFKCDECELTFTRVGGLKRHTLIKHGKKLSKKPKTCEENEEIQV